MTKKVYLGIDVGSISTNFVIIDESKEVLFQKYIRGGGSPIKSVQTGMQNIAEQFGDTVDIRAIGATGSGRTLTGMMIGADIIKNEISAHARAALQIHPEVRTIFEIGGQDSKVCIVENGTVVDFAMNLVCAAGTGSFLDSQARRLEITIRDMSEQSIFSENPTSIAGRCAVFAESDMIHKQQVGHEQKDIIMGLCHALVRNYLSNVCRGKRLEPPFLFQGGVSENKGIIRAFEEALGHPVIIPQYNMVMGAFGVALLAADHKIEKTKFRGFDFYQHEIGTRVFNCRDCTNICEIIELVDSGKVIGRTGGRCLKWEGNISDKVNREKPAAHSNLRSLPKKMQECNISDKNN